MKKNVFYFLILLVVSCQMKAPIVNEPVFESNEKIIAIAEEYFDDKYAMLENSEGDYTIVFTKFKEFQDLFATTKFFVYELKTDSIILEDELSSGVVKWHSSYEIQAILRDVDEENSSSTPMSTYYFNVLNKTKSDSVD